MGAIGMGRMGYISALSSREIVDRQENISGIRYQALHPNLNPNPNLQKERKVLEAYIMA